MMNFFSTFEAAKFCQVSAGSILRWIHEGKLSASETPGGHFRIKEEDLRNLMKNLGIPFSDQSGAQKESSVKRTVLIVDDEVAIRRLLRNFFERTFPDFEVKEAKNGFEAGWIAHSTRPDVVLLDLMLPGMNGSKICELIRGFPGFAEVKIIAMSGYGKEKASGMLRQGADDFLEKPFEWDDLRAKIEAYFKDDV